MNKGKDCCEILKNIRLQIAQENEIPFQIEACTFEGDCRGTCPRCEAELLYLEQKIAEKKQLGKRALVAGISLGVMATFFSCQTEGDIPAPEENFPQDSARQTETVQQPLKKMIPTIINFNNSAELMDDNSNENISIHCGGIETEPIQPFLMVNLNELLPDSLKKIKVEDFIRNQEPSK